MKTSSAKTAGSTRDQEMRSVVEFMQRYVPHSLQSDESKNLPLGLSSIVSPTEFNRVKRKLAKE